MHPAEYRMNRKKGTNVRLANLDLNLLVALDALLQECSVTRAAERLGLSQPTLSASLARLRRHFDDQLLYRTGNSYNLTPLALTLAARTASALDEVERIFNSHSAGDPLVSTREFVLICSDYTAFVVGSRLSAAMAREAPHAVLHLRHRDPDRYTNDLERLRSVDGILMPHGFLHGAPHLDLYQDRWVCLVASDNESVGDQLTVADLSRLPWVVTSHGATYSTTAIRQLTQLGVQVDAQTAVDSFASVPFMIAGTNRIALIQHRLISMYGDIPGVRVLECPVDAGSLTEALWWHPDFERDAEHKWLRDLLATITDGHRAHQSTASPIRDSLMAPALTR